MKAPHALPDLCPTPEALVAVTQQLVVLAQRYTALQAQAEAEERQYWRVYDQYIRLRHRLALGGQAPLPAPVTTAHETCWDGLPLFAQVDVLP